MSITDHLFRQTCEIIATEINGAGDQVETSRKEWPCWFRESTDVTPGNNSEEISTNDAIIRLPAEAPVIEGTLIAIENKTWRVNRLIKARRLSGDVICLKVYLQKNDGPVTT